MRFEENISDDAITRLRRVEGQVGGVIRMLEEGRDCKQVMQQVSAASKALERAGVRLLAAQMRHCVIHEGEEGVETVTPEEIEQMFLNLA
jgi:DNA-binding FrmR family transcriptional regulator